MGQFTNHLSFSPDAVKAQLARDRKRALLRRYLRTRLNPRRRWLRKNMAALRADRVKKEKKIWGSHVVPKRREENYNYWMDY